MIFKKYLFIYFISLLGSEMLLKIQASSGKFCFLRDAKHKNQS